jgi:hypothetical protein
MAMRDIRASVEVRALIGAEKLRELHGKVFAQYECWQCGGKARTTEATSVIVAGHRAFRVVMLAHTACADSHIMEVDADMMSAVAGKPRHPRNPAIKPGERQGGARREDDAAVAQAGSGR